MRAMFESLFTVAASDGAACVIFFYHSLKVLMHFVKVVHYHLLTETLSYNAYLLAMLAECTQCRQTSCSPFFMVFIYLK